MCQQLSVDRLCYQRWVEFCLPYQITSPLLLKSVHNPQILTTPRQSNHCSILFAPIRSLSLFSVCIGGRYGYMLMAVGRLVLIGRNGDVCTEVYTHYVILVLVPTDCGLIRSSRTTLSHHYLVCTVFLEVVYPEM